MSPKLKNGGKNYVPSGLEAGFFLRPGGGGHAEGRHFSRFSSVLVSNRSKNFPAAPAICSISGPGPGVPKLKRSLFGSVKRKFGVKSRRNFWLLTFGF